MNQSTYDSEDNPAGSHRRKKQTISRDIISMYQQGFKQDEIEATIIERYKDLFTDQHIKDEINKAILYQNSPLVQNEVQQVLPINTQQSMSMSFQLKTNSQLELEQQLSQHGSQVGDNFDNMNNSQIKIPKQLRQVQKPPKPGQGAIDNFVKPKNVDAAKEINGLKDQVQSLKKQLAEQQSQINNQIKVTTPTDDFINKIQLALSLHEKEVNEIQDRFSLSRSLEKIKNPDGTQSCLEQDRLQQLVSRSRVDMENIQSKLENSQVSQSVKFELTLQFNELIAQIQTYEQQIERMYASAEEEYMNTRQYMLIKQKSRYRQFRLPCFYPPFALMQAPLLSFQQIKLPPFKPQFILLRVIGEGGFSMVYKAFNIQRCQFVALKISQYSSDTRWKLIQREATIYSQLQHQNIVVLYQPPIRLNNQQSLQQVIRSVNSQFDEQPDEIALEQELCDGCSLYDYICVAMRKKSIQEKQVLAIFAQIADALAYLHKQNLTHNDISYNNILRKDKVWKLADFTLAKQAEQQSNAMTTLGGTKPFTAPERFRGIFGPASDVYSLGVTMIASFTGNIQIFEQLAQKLQLKENIDVEQELQQYMSTNHPLVAVYSEETQKLMLSMVSLLASKRPSSQQVLDALLEMLKKQVKKVRQKSIETILKE